MSKKLIALITALILLVVGTCLGICPPRPNPDGLLLGASETTPMMRSDILGTLPQQNIPPQGNCHILVLLVDFSDKPHSLPPSYFQDKLFGSGVNTFAKYFEKNSYGKFRVSGDIYGWIQSDCLHSQIVNRDGVPGTDDDYGLDTSGKEIDQSICEFPLNIWGLVANAVTKAAQSIDLKAYDKNNDGWLDALIVIHSGLGAEYIYSRDRNDAPNHIWSLKSDLDHYRHTKGTTFQGVRIGPFVIVPEFGETGTFAHEFCHLLGLPDLYNTKTGQSVVGSVCLMDVGSWNGPNGDGSVPSTLSAPMKYFLGWVEPQIVCIGCDGSEQEEVEIAPQSLRGDVYQALSNPRGPDWSPKGTGIGEYFLVENRQRAAGDFETYIPGSGLLIWKVDESQIDNNHPNDRLVALIEANHNGLVEGDDFWPGPLGKREFTPYTDPSSSLRGGRFSGVAISDITELASLKVGATISVGVPRRGLAYAFPNPYRIGEATKLHIVFLPEVGPERPEPGTVSAIIFDLEGNFIRRLDKADEINQSGTALWDIKDESGKTVSPGLYFFVVNWSRQQASGTILIKP